jgi:uncharacterized protein (TIGR02145 family)
MKKVLSLMFLSSICYSQVLDVDNNEYQIINIGEQQWFSKNLMVKHYSDGTPIPQVTSPVEWEWTNIGAWCYINNDPSTEQVYGILYNNLAILGIHDNDPETPNKSIAVPGSKAPSVDDFEILIQYAGGYENAGNSLKSNQGWNSFNGNNGNGTNTTGFNAIPSGNRTRAGSFQNLGDNAVFHRTGGGSGLTSYFALNFVNNNAVISVVTGNWGQSLRLIRDLNGKTWSDDNVLQDAGDTNIHIWRGQDN